MIDRVVIILIIMFLVRVGEAQGQAIYDDNERVNFMDENNQKQGKWIYYYDSGEKYSEGSYENNQKQGEWIEYYRNGNYKSKIEYKNNRQDGQASFFYENGQISESGTWKQNRWVGDYTYYHPTGKVAYEWHYNEEGKRTGEQKYYYENGNLRVMGTWEGGIEQGSLREYYDSGKLRAESQWKGGRVDGTMKEYYENGTVKAERVFHDGIYDADISKVYATPTRTASTVTKPQNQTQPPQVKKEEDKPVTTTPASVFTGNGYHKIYNSETKKLEKEGTFKNGQFVQGKRYFYDANGELIKTAIYENGRIVRLIERK